MKFGEEILLFGDVRCSVGRSGNEPIIRVSETRAEKWSVICLGHVA